MSGFAQEPPASIDLTEDQQDSGGGSSTDDLQNAIDALMSFLQSHKDAEERAQGSKALAILHQLQAIDQKQGDATMGVTPGMKLARKNG